MMPSFVLNSTAVATALLLTVSSGSAATVLDQSNFSSTASTVDFDNFTASNQSVSGATFGNFTLSGNVSLFQPATWGGGSPGRNTLGALGFQIQFDSAISEVGFNFGSNRASVVDVSFFDGGTLLDTQTLNADGSGNWNFSGFSSSPFDRLVFGQEQTANFTYGVYDVTYASAIAPVPLPAGFPLLAAALGAFAFMRQRSKMAAVG